MTLTRLLSDNLSRATISPPSRPPRPRRHRTIAEIIAPYPRFSAFLYNRSFWRSGSKTKRDRSEFIQDVLLHPEFRTEDIAGIDFDQLDETVVCHHQALKPAGHLDDDDDSLRGRGWTESIICIDVPTGQKLTKAVKKKKAASRRRLVQDRKDASDADSDDEPDIAKLQRLKLRVPGFHHRNLMDLLIETCNGQEAKNFHWHPYEEHWHPPWPGATAERVHGELYASKAFLDADHALHQSPPEPGCDLPRAIIAIMFYSDATHLAQFGQASLHPIYVFFGNQSKYDRGVRACNAVHNLAFLPGVSQIIIFVRNATGHKASCFLLRHLKRELYQGCWETMFDEHFLLAYEHGFISDCGDDIQRRLYPRIILSSDDYLEKAMLVCIRAMGLFACPRCLIPKKNFWMTGQEEDLKQRQELIRHDDAENQGKISAARRLIYERGYVVNSERVESHLKEQSLLPTQSAFSHLRLRNCGLDAYSLMAADVMHEVELGVWRSLLEHLIRILHAHGSGAIQEFDTRFHKVAPFGRNSTIRKFTYNVSELRRLAARDYEDILQCCIPCIEGLLPEPDNQTILDLLYLMAYFHSLVKLRMHTDSSLQVLKKVTVNLCDGLRYFADETCAHYDTVETDKEFQARKRQKAAEDLQKGKAPKDSTDGGRVRSDVVVVGKRPKSFSLDTPKFHMLADYPDQILQFGTTDSYSTKPGESHHRVLKSFYHRTNKNNAIPQIARIDNITCIHQQMDAELAALQAAEKDEAMLDDEDNEQELQHSLATEALADSYYVASNDIRNKVHLPTWLEQHREDPALKCFIPQLRAYLLAQLLSSPFTGEPPSFTSEELSDVIIENNVVYEHRTARFNFTTYDVRREQEGINTNRRHGGDRVRCDVMLPGYDDPKSGMDPHPFWYARVLGVFHARVYFRQTQKTTLIPFLWVRWFGRDPEWLSGPAALRLDRIGFIPPDQPDAFGFIHPSIVIRPCHLIPTFSIPRTNKFIGASIARNHGGDWENYYLSRFSDRDLMMRYLGLGVGHRNAAEFPREDEMLRTIPSGASYEAVTPEHRVQPEVVADEQSEPEDDVDAWLRTQIPDADSDALEDVYEF
ncbi:hypothetical protein BDN72DRAFT_948719 [Pluteus cervinus]|uniref:Uncharacterized protein n=1 Tax=Pluteus cervinus TaxID=181527 RepID=A0ACD2ZZ68_9AGAR|nr:hypothetical protein BDN72DRAFT_948719 [Pluteus cervinus]